MPFREKGVPSVQQIEDKTGDFNAHYHAAGDTVAHMDPAYWQAMMQGLVATIATWSGPQPLDQATATPPPGPGEATPTAAAPSLGGCPMLPADDIWNTRVDGLPAHPRSAEWLASIGLDTGLHADFGSGLWAGGPIGIPYVLVPEDQPRVPLRFEYADESDPGPYPIPTDAPIEGGPQSSGDRHVLVLQQGSCRLYETWSTYPEAGGAWRAGSGAVFDLGSSRLRPDGWTSADAAGLPILPGLVRYDEVAAGVIRHAIRFTASRTQRAYVWPARHYASSIRDPAVPPMGQRFRLRPDIALDGFSPPARVILTAMRDYGLILADNGSDWFVSGLPDERWDNDVLRELRRVQGRDFEAVDVAGLMIDPDSGQARQPGGVPTPSPEPTGLPQPSAQPSASATPGPGAEATPSPTATRWTPVGPTAPAAWLPWLGRH